MKKDIYIIKNRINDKIYIGQTVNPKQRWAQYKSAVLKTPNAQLITKAMNKYGIDNFWMEVIESSVENYNEREQYWIKFYNSITPNGYNMADGGDGSGNGIYAATAAIKDADVLNSIIDDLIIDVESLQQLAQKYSVSVLVISEINQGHTYYNPDLHYPLRESKRYSDDKLKQITYALKYELDKSMRDLAKEYKCDVSYLNDINQGRAHFRDYLIYPLRKGKMKRAEEIFPQIVYDLKTTTLKSAEIARKYNVSDQCVSDINTGRKFYQASENYPIRKRSFDGKTCFTPNELQSIYKDLKETKLSYNKLGEKYGVSAQMLSNLNRGKIKKYFDADITYPIRPLKR